MAGRAARQAPPSQDGDGADRAAERRGARAARRGRRARRRRASCKEAGVEAIAVCFLFSYLDPAHEARALRDRARGVSRTCFVTHLVVGVAAVPRVRALHHDGDERLRRARKVRNYVTRLETGARGSRASTADLHIMASNGGVATPRDGGRAAGAHAAVGPGGRRARRRLGGRRSSGRRNLITFDVGGTSADIGIVTDGGFGEATARDTWIARLSRCWCR